MSSHTTTALRVVALASACGLVIASAGFGAVFAYRVGIEHSILLAGLSILMAVALEGMKPLAIAAAFQSIASLKIIRGASLAALGLVAVAYSLTSELTLVSMSRGDLVAERASQVDLHKELKSLGSPRPATEVQAEISAIDQTPGIMIDGVPCGGTINGKVTKEWCPQRALLVAEKARADRKAELEAKLTKGRAVKAADPGSTALATYLAALGVVVPIEVISQWLNLVPVLALEIGSALAAVLVQAVGGSDRGPATKPVKQGRRKPRKRQQEVEAKVLKHLKRTKEAPVTERGLAALLGSVSRSTVRRSIHSLAAAGIIALEASRHGTVVRLLS